MELQIDTGYLISGKVTEYRKWNNSDGQECVLINEMDSEFEIIPVSDEELDLLDDSVNGTDTLVINFFNNWQILNLSSSKNVIVQTEDAQLNNDLLSIDNFSFENVKSHLESIGFIEVDDPRYEFNAPVSILEM